MCALVSFSLCVTKYLRKEPKGQQTCFSSWLKRFQAMINICDSTSLVCGQEAHHGSRCDRRKLLTSWQSGDRENDKKALGVRQYPDRRTRSYLLRHFIYKQQDFMYKEKTKSLNKVTTFFFYSLNELLCKFIYFQ